MWLMTSFGFFSVVRKEDQGPLTVRSRTRGDLDRLRAHYLPELGPSLAHQGTDYPWRAVVEAQALTKAMTRIIEDLEYSNFKDEVARTLGKARAKRYGQVWSALCDLPEDLPEPGPSQVLPWPVKAPKGKALAYGGVVIDQQGHLLLREVANHYDGYVWSFAKGRPDAGESPQACALREVLEEMGVYATIITALFGEFAGGTTLNRYFLMCVDRRQVELAFSNDETAGLCWAAPDEARSLIGQTTNQTGRQRDLAVLDAALACLPVAPPLQRPIALRRDWKTRPFPAMRKSLPLGMRFPVTEMTRIWRGYVPAMMEQKWFAFFEDGVLHLHRSWTGNAIYRVFFEPVGDAWEAVRFEVSRHALHNSNTDNEEDRRLIEDLVRHMLAGGSDHPSVDGMVEAFQLASQPGYLGSPGVVHELVIGYLDVLVRQHEGRATYADAESARAQLVQILCGQDPAYTVMPGWHSAEQLGQELVGRMNLDKDYCADENLGFIAMEGLCSLSLAVSAHFKAVLAEPDKVDGQTLAHRLFALVPFTTAVLLGTASVTYPDKTLADFQP